MSPQAAVAYFSMEVGLDPAIPTYSGGLGILAGDTLRSAADLHIPMVGISLLHRKGYFRQHLDGSGLQTESSVEWHPEQHLEASAPVVTITIEDRPVKIRAWQFLVRGVSGHTVPVYFLDTALPENNAWDQTLPSQFPETNTAEPEPAQIPAASTADTASVVLTA